MNNYHGKAKQEKIILFRIFNCILIFALLIFVIACTGNNKKEIIYREYGNEYVKNTDSNIVRVEPSKFSDFNEFYKRIQKIVCSDSIPKIVIRDDKVVKTIYLINLCWKHYSCKYIRHKNILRIQPDSVFKKGNSYPIDSLYQILEKDYSNFGKNPFYSSHPTNLLLFVSSKNNGIKSLKRLILKITKAYDRIKPNSDLRLILQQT